MMKSVLGVLGVCVLLIILMSVVWWTFSQDRQKFHEESMDQIVGVEDDVLALGQEDLEIVNEAATIENEDLEGVEVDESLTATESDFVLRIETDDVLVESDVFAGVKANSLDRGVGRHYTTALPNSDKGNVVLSGHQFYPGNQPGHTVFKDLNKLEVGEEVLIDYQGQEYTYKVRNTKIVDPTDVSILKQTDDPQLTLYTCYPPFTTERRLVYIADLISVK